MGRVQRGANQTIVSAALREAGELPPQAQDEDQANAKAAIRAKMLDNLQLRDLRRTGMVQLAVAGATTLQIAALSDHAQKIPDTALLGGRGGAGRHQDVGPVAPARSCR
jgi:ribosomal protein L25 (general stress protein Ctc)